MGAADPPPARSRAGCTAGNGTPLQTWDWLDNDCQRFYFQNVGGGFYHILPGVRGRDITSNNGAIDVASCAAPNPAYVTVQVYDWLNNDFQKWSVTMLGDGYVRLTPRFDSTTALDVKACGSTHGTQVGLWTWLNNDCQRFALQPAS